MDFHIVSSLWLATYFMNLLAWVSEYVYSDEYWSLTSGLLSAFGIPNFQDGAPLGGFFHKLGLDSQEAYVWVFDGGVTFSWLLFNLLTVALIVKLLLRLVFPIEENKKSEKRAVYPNMDYSICQCANPVLIEGTCSTCGKRPSSERIEKINKSKQGLVSESKCSACGKPLVDGNKFCSNCGEPVLQKELESNEDVVCDQCGADLVLNQKFCGTCGVEIDWVNPNLPNQQKESTNKSENKKYWIVAAVVVGVIVLASLFSSGGVNQQEECFNREMQKFGAFADPKGWAIKSRLYCQSMYP